MDRPPTKERDQSSLNATDSEHDKPDDNCHGSGNGDEICPVCSCSIACAGCEASIIDLRECCGLFHASDPWTAKRWKEGHPRFPTDREPHIDSNRSCEWHVALV